MNKRQYMISIPLFLAGLLICFLSFATVAKERNREQQTIEPITGLEMQSDSPNAFSMEKEMIDSLTSRQKQAAAFCEGDGTTGIRIQVMYAHTSGTPSRYTELLPQMRQMALEASAAIDDNAVQTGGRRIIRFLTDRNCNIQVTDITVKPENITTLGGIFLEIDRQGYSKPDRKFMIFADTEAACGVSTVMNDDSPGQANKNLRLSFGAVWLACKNYYAYLHELLHGLGAVQTSAPNSTGSGHCTDGYDVMCNKDGPDVVIRSVCEESTFTVVDCNFDDYFNTNPAPDSYLATHWNVAYNIYLDDPTRDTTLQAKRTGNPKMVKVVLKGLAPKESLTFHFDSKTVLKTVTATDAGTWKGRVTIPKKTKRGGSTLSAWGGFGSYAEDTVSVPKQKNGNQQHQPNQASPPAKHSS